MEKKKVIEGRIMRAWHADIINPFTGKIIKTTNRFNDLCLLMAFLTNIAEELSIATFTIHESVVLVEKKDERKKSNS